MRLEPFVRVNDTPFSVSQLDVLQSHGRPAREARNAVNLTELDYGHVVFRFQDGGRLEEVTMQAPILKIGTIAVPFANLAAFVHAQDLDAFERAGFLVSPRFGLAFVPSQPHWVTALAQHCLPAWRTL